MSKLLPDSIRKRIERACDEAERPKGMTTGDGRARVQSSDVRRLLRLVDFIEEHGTRYGGAFKCPYCTGTGKCQPCGGTGKDETAERNYEFSRDLGDR